MTVNELLKELTRIKDEYDGGEFSIEFYNDVDELLLEGDVVDLNTINANPSFETVSLS